MSVLLNARGRTNDLRAYTFISAFTQEKVQVRNVVKNVEGSVFSGFPFNIFNDHCCQYLNLYSALL